MARLELRAFSLPFLGGPISAALLGLCFEPFQHRVLYWFALVPLLLSLWRNGSRPWVRLAHGLSFGWVLAAFSLLWMFEDLTAGAGAGASSPVTGVLLCAAAWSVPALLAGTFALAAGPILRARSGVTVAVLLPGLWIGLDVLRGYLLQGESPWLGQWLSLGYGLPPGAPEAQVASLFGVYGLGYLIAGNSTLLFLVIRDHRATRQIAWALAGTVLPLACYGYGAYVVPPDEPDGSAAVVVAAQEQSDLPSLVALSSRLGAEKADLIVWPPVSADLLPTDGEAPGDALRPATDLAGRAEATLVACGGGRESRAGDRVPVRVLVLGPEGRLVPAEDPSARSPVSHPPWVVSGPLGNLGIAAGSGFASPFAARDAVQRGADILVVSATDVHAPRGTPYHQLAVMESLRAIENRRAVAWSGRGGAFVVDPWGRKTLQILSGVDSAGVEGVILESGGTFYTAWGWCLEVVWALLAVSLLISGYARHRPDGRGQQPALCEPSPDAPWWYRDPAREVPEPGVT